MTNYRIFLLSFLTVLWVFLSGFNKPADNDVPALETQKTEAELKLIETGNNRKTLNAHQIKAERNVIPVNASPQKTKQTTIKAIGTSIANENNPVERDEFEKPLDLSVPDKVSENALLKIENKSVAQSQATDIFVPDTKNKPRSLELDGDFVMSPEPEAEKRKSVDGAGIVIKLKP